MIIVILLAVLLALFCMALAITGLVCWACGDIFSWSAVAFVWLVLLIAFVAVGGIDPRD